MGERRRLGAIIVVWTAAAIGGLTVALLAVGWLGLWVAVGAFAGLGTTVVGGWLGQILFTTDFDALLADRSDEDTDRDKPS
jgi:fatty acid desaturase